MMRKRLASFTAISSAIWPMVRAGLQSRAILDASASEGFGWLGHLPMVGVVLEHLHIASFGLLW